MHDIRVNCISRTWRAQTWRKRFILGCGADRANSEIQDFREAAWRGLLQYGKLVIFDGTYRCGVRVDIFSTIRYDGF